MPHVKQWIADRGASWLEDLAAEFKVDANRDGDLVSLKYNQIESPMFSPLVQECRGMVVDTSTGRILCHPYNKFWNLGEHLAAPIDWSTARVQDKLDGSLMLLYEHGGFWHVASSGTPRAGGRYGKEELLFRDRFWQVFYGAGMSLPNRGLSDVGFFFELCAPDNRIVVKYDNPKLILHGARNRETEQEIRRDVLESISSTLFWPIVKEYPLQSEAEVDEAVKALNPVDHEGFIVVDAACNRVKVKSPRYVALHHLRDRTTPSAVIALWKAGEVGELLTYFPEHAPDVLAMTGKLEAAATAAFDAYIRHRHAPTRKEYAEAVKGQPWQAIAFKLLSNEASTHDDALAILRASSDAACERLLEAA